MTAIECLTWNVHRGRGQDGRIDTGRTLDALLELVDRTRPALVVLTEADAEQPPYAGILDIGRLEAETGLRHAQADRRLRWGPDSHGFLGTLVFHRPHLVLTDGAVLDLPGRYPRGASMLTFRTGEDRFRLVATHLSLGQVLRAAQMRAIGQYLDRVPAMPTLLVGDLNEWRPWGGLALSETLVGHAFRGPAPRSFPSARPLLSLDRVLATPPARVLSAETVASAGLRRISDHLPVRASVTLGRETRF